MDLGTRRDGKAAHFLLVVFALVLVLGPSLAFANKGNRGGGGGRSDKDGGGGQEGGDKGGGEDGPRDGIPEAKTEEAYEKQVKDEGRYEIVDSPFEALEIQCIEEKNANACFQAATAWKEGSEEVKSNTSQAANLFSAGCSFGSGPSCMAAAQMYLRNETGMQLIMPEGIVELDFGEAARLLDEACAYGIWAGCGLLGDVYLRPQSLIQDKKATFRGVKPDLLRAMQAFRRGCDPARVERIEDLSTTEGKKQADIRSCARLAELHVSRQSGQLSYELAADYGLRACLASGETSLCDRAAELRKMAEDGGPPKADSPGEGEGGDNEASGPNQGTSASKQGGLSRPEAERFRDEETGADVEKKDRFPIRVDLVIGVGARWLFEQPNMAGTNWQAGASLWFNIIGFSLETEFHTDKLLQPTTRVYTRFMHSLSVQGAIPLPFKLTIPARLYIVFGMGGALGTLSLAQGPYLLSGGLREFFQFVISTDHRNGPRQWGAVRYEQQQSWREGAGDTVEHGGKITFLFGFAFGGWGPRLKR